MGSACSGTSSSAYIEKPPSGIQSNGQYVVDGVVIPRRELTAAEATRRGLKEDSWRGSKMGRTSTIIVQSCFLFLATTVLLYT